MNPAVSQLFADPNTGQVDKERARLIIKQLIEAPAGNPAKGILVEYGRASKHGS